jgi:hypothetical protein
MKTPLKRRATASATLCVSVLGLFALGARALHAEEAFSAVLGVVPISVAAGTGTTTRTLSPISFPLLEDAVVAGQGRGRITGVTANTITNSDAGWTAGQLSTAATPCLIQITSGAAAGRVFLVSTSTASQSTATTLTIDSEEAGLVNLTTLGIVTGASGDTYRILACDTIGSIFGTPVDTGVLGSTDATTADNIQIMISGAWRQYYYRTTSPAGWVRIGFTSVNNNIPIRPDVLVLYNRLGNTPVNLTLLGSVPTSPRKSLVKNLGVTPMAGGWPVNLTLSSSSINTIPGWVSNTDPNVADNVQLLVSGAWRNYYHNGTNWVRVGFTSNSNTVSLNAGAGFLINKKGATAGTAVLAQPLPYNL